VIDGSEDPWREEIAAMTIEYHVGFRRIEMRSLYTIDPDSRRHASHSAPDIRPVQATITRDLQVAIISPHPDYVAVNW
jgi:hypothetical protein